jgi:hypothetical protein
MFRQLIQPYVENPTSTTPPFKASIVRGLLLIQPYPEMTGAGATPSFRVLSLDAVCQTLVAAQNPELRTSNVGLKFPALTIQAKILPRVGAVFRPHMAGLVQITFWRRFTKIVQAASMGSFPENFDQCCLSQLVGVSVIIGVFKSNFAGRRNELAQGGVQLFCALFHSFPFLCPAKLSIRFGDQVEAIFAGDNASNLRRFGNKKDVLRIRGNLAAGSRLNSNLAAAGEWFFFAL